MPTPSKLDRNTGLEEDRKEAISAAQDFRYPKEVIEALKDAGTSDELSKIMHSARMRRRERDMSR